MACGLSRDAILTRHRHGFLHRLHRCVYAVGHPNVALEGRFLAAVKACGPGAVLSHRATGAYWKMIEWEHWPIEVTVTGDATRLHDGLRVHRTTWLPRRDIMIRDGIPMTAPWRTILDLAAVLGDYPLRRALRQALSLELVSVRKMLDLIDEAGPRRGTRKLAKLLATAEPTRSEFEDIVLDLILGGGFEPPDVNKPLRLNGRTVIPDFRWPKQRLVVEADGRRWHDNAVARAEDRARQDLLETHGETVVRVTWNQATRRRAETRRRIAAAGGPRRPQPPDTAAA